MKLKIYTILILSGFILSCKKDFLEVKSDKKLVIPSTLQDFQALIDNTEVNNANMPNLGEIGSDDYYLKYETWNIITQPNEKNAYIWAKDVYQGTTTFWDWTNRYQQVFYANNVLEGLEKIKDIDNQETYNYIKGSALFYRAYAFYQLAQLFCAPYSLQSDNNGAGIPIRLKSDINLPTVRATIEESYQQILSDLHNALSLLPKTVSYKTRVTQAAATALLSRVYLLTQDYDNALLFADSTLNADYTLINFNELIPASPYPMQRYNQEVLFQSTMTAARVLLSSRLIVDSVLFKSYSGNDLRKAVWFGDNAGNKTFKGSYDGSSVIFNGLALDEVYLNKAECLARKDQADEAMSVLNDLLITRWKTDPVTSQTLYVNQSATDKDDALRKILLERRKELIFRGIRWSDLRRLNLDPATSRSLYRVLNGQTYELKPNGLNYVLPIQDDVIQISGILQNPRE